MTQHQRDRTPAPPDIQRILKQSAFNELMKLTEDLNIFDIVDSCIDENAYSRFLAYLFDSRRPHKFGIRVFLDWVSTLTHSHPEFSSAFSNAFLQSIKSTAVEVEWGTDERRRLDILVSMRDDHNRTIGVLGVENKVWSGEQDEQLSAYQVAIATKFPAVSNKVLIFLTPDGRTHSTGSKSADCPVYCAPYSTLNVVATFDRTSITPHDAMILQSFQHHLQKKFTGRSPMELDAEKLVKKLYADPANRDALRFIAKHIPTPKSFMEIRMPELLEHELKRKIKVSWSYPKSNTREINYSVGDIGEGNPFIKTDQAPWVGVYFMILSNGPIDIGSEIKLQVMLNDDSASANSRAEVLKKALPASQGGRQWSPWKLIWTGGSHVLTDLGETDERAIVTLFTDAIDKTYAPIRNSIKLLAKGC